MDSAPEAPDDGPADAMSATTDASRIAVSVIMPVLNEGRHLRAAVRRVLGQEWPGRLEVILSVGPSRDDTDEIAAALAEEDPRVVVVANPSGRTPDALNRAVDAATGEVIVRVDGHAEIADDYIATAVATLLETGADNVGGMMDARGITTFERAVAVAMKSPVGVGNSRFHVGGEAGPTVKVTVEKPVYKRWWFWTGLGVAAVLGIGGTINAAIAVGKHDDWENEGREEDRKAGKRSAVLADVFLFTGLATAVAVSIAAIVVEVRRKKKKKEAASITPSCGPGGCGVFVKGSF